MKTIKTAVVVVLLLAVLYGVYTVLNKPENAAVTDAAWPQTGPLQIDSGTPMAPGEPAPDRELAAGADPPDMPAGIPSTLGSEFTSGAREIPGKKPPASGGSAYAPKKDSTSADGSFVQRAAATAASRSLGPRAFGDAMRAAERQIQEGRYRQALASLSIFHDSPDLTADEQRQLLDVLDPLAGKVIYSTEHLLETPYDARKDETLYDVARAYNVPWLLLKNVNSVNDPDILLPGTRLKVVRGPFRAEIKLQRASQGELTLFLGELYAGRFPVTVGNDQPVRPGLYEVQDKREWPVYYAPSGQSLPSRHAQNPYGRWFLDLGNDICIHSSPTAGGDSRGAGCISLSPIDAGDIYGILDVGAKVEIRQ